MSDAEVISFLPFAIVDTEDLPLLGLDALRAPLYWCEYNPATRTKRASVRLDDVQKADFGLSRTHVDYDKADYGLEEVLWPQVRPPPMCGGELDYRRRSMLLAFAKGSLSPVLWESGFGLFRLAGDRYLAFRREAIPQVPAAPFRAFRCPGLVAAVWIEGSELRERYPHLSSADRIGAWVTVGLLGGRMVRCARPERVGGAGNNLRRPMLECSA